MSIISLSEFGFSFSEMYASNLCMSEYDATVSGRGDGNLLTWRCPLRILYFKFLNTVIEKFTFGSSVSVRDVTVIQSGFLRMTRWLSSLSHFSLEYNSSILWIKLHSSSFLIFFSISFFSLTFLDSLVANGVLLFVTGGFDRCWGRLGHRLGNA